MNTLFSRFSRKKKNAVKEANDKNAENEKEKVSQNNNPEDEICFKVAFLGDSGVGAKTSFVIRYVRDTFSYFGEPTIGAAFYPKNLVIRGKKVKLELWDTAGQERFASLAPMYFRGAYGIVIGYDITSRSSFDRARWWLSHIKHDYPDDRYVLMIIGNKVDLEAERKVSYEEGEELAREFDVPLFFEVSAKTGYNVNESMEELADLILEFNGY